MPCLAVHSSTAVRDSACRAAIFATVSGLLGGWIAVLGSISATPDGHLPAASLYRGIAESLTVGFASFGLLAAAWMLVALGVLRRQALT